MIKSFKCKKTKVFWDKRAACIHFRSIAVVVMRKLRMLNAAIELDDLKSPPGNRLELLHGTRKGQYSIRINQQYRVCFKWNDGAESVEIVDYH
ncbi:MAG: type II toxin-antitoxin system RelE/ParE family toxin [Victivallales bacterium]|nr:type II toxin-antitoxin system RelE/ParE family toxin [Victivallales bacterium]